jgi:hypothetical protein
MKTKNSNRNSRGIVSALRSDHKSLRVAAVQIIDEALKKDAERAPYTALMIAFGATHGTAYKILRERARVTKTGARRS